MKITTISLLMIIIICVEAQNPQQHDSISRRLKEIVKKIHNEDPNTRERDINYRFKGKIEIINKNTIKYDDEVMIIYTEEKYKKIFEKGIFLPSLITGPVKTGKEREEELKSMYKRNDSIAIVNFVEKVKFHSTPDKREFSFLVYYKRHMNPTEYNITLTNKDIDFETDLETFINGAIATRIKFITIWI